ncbi:MAG: CoA transferase [Candidatus Aminicenantes bacterium]|nr:CoA transferase [Candidatus Aminicenantes bacterium]NIM82392.1 CoA transferase [Candidatus Aminicenantes bacterium]NIN24229.1 CoA transferase [Candidatus Aminicenantes bacterium]NIN47956.1 CoA transferase [Candidatus Aminicenantes bacterium]NIN90892.1 CoA transferase [Candidatus Aminicenantes bacterium]
MKPQVVLSMEQALTMTYATLRCVHLGWRVIKLESTPLPGQMTKGDPNRYIGRPVAGEDRHSYFVAPNPGKEAIAIDLKNEEGRELVKRLIKELNVDVFCTNTMPARHKQLGVDYETLRNVREDLIWCSISAMGIKYPRVPGYDPVMQALCGYMDITGYPDGPPLQCGPPLVDLKAGDEAFTQIILALAERMETGKGKMIDISMAQVAVSWLQTFLPMLDMGSPPSELKRSGNQHRQFIPVNVYKTADGFIYIAVGSNPQWSRFTKMPMFEELDQECYCTNEGRREHQEELYAKIEAITMKHSCADISMVLEEAAVPHSRITPIEDVFNLLFVAETALKTMTPDGGTVRLPPPAQGTEYLEEINGTLPFAPAYGEHTDALLKEIGLSAKKIASLREQGIVA